MSLKQFIPAVIVGLLLARFAAVAHARLAARRYYATGWLAQNVRHLIMVPVVRDIGRRHAASDR